MKTADPPRQVSWLSIARAPRRTLIVGVGVARSREDRTFCAIVQLALVYIGIGPHYTPERAILSLPYRPRAALRQPGADG